MHNISVNLEQIYPLIQEQLAAGESVQFTPRGVSMRPMIYGDRDQVILSPAPAKLRKYDIPLYRRNGGQFVLHRIVKVGENYTCIGDNQYVYEPGVRHDQVIGVTTGFIRNGKQHSVHSVSYWLYCRFWHYSRPVRKFCRRVKGYILGKLKKLV